MKRYKNKTFCGNFTYIKVLTLVFLFTLIFSFFNFSFAETNDLNIYSDACILIESSTGKIIYEKNAYEKMYPASTTKIMTAILALENCELTDITTVSKEAVNNVPYSYTTAYLQVGENLTIYQLLNVLLIPSANDAAFVLAEHIAGSVDSFASMMNTKAIEIGCKNTHFVNPNGIHNENHYTTAYDLALIGRYAMNNKTFRDIVSTKNYTLPATNKWTENNRYFENTNQLLLPDSRDAVDNYYYEGTTGIKTGYTNPAKDCIVASAKRNDTEFIVVILGGDKTENGLSGRYLDCKTLFNYAFDNFKTYKIHDANSVLKQVDVLNATRNTKTLDIIVKDEINALISSSYDISSISPDISIEKLKAPIIKNSVIGTVTYNIDGITYSSNLLAGSDVEKSEFFNLLFKFVLLIFVLYILFKVIKLKNKKKKVKYKKSKNKYNKR